jgi:hypothetical protein
MLLGPPPRPPCLQSYCRASTRCRIPPPHHHTDAFSLFVSFLPVCAGGALLVAEMLLDEGGTSPPEVLLQSLNMLTQTHGRERKLSEYSHMLESVGFRNIQGKKTGGKVVSVQSFLREAGGGWGGPLHSPTVLEFRSIQGQTTGEQVCVQRIWGGGGYTATCWSLSASGTYRARRQVGGVCVQREGGGDRGLKGGRS